MSRVPALTAAPAPATRPGYDPDAGATARRVLPMLDDERVVWLSTVQPDGRPHLVPTWFWWDGEALLLWSKPEAVKVRNLRANPRLMVAVGDPGEDFSVGLIEAEAELVERPVPDAFFAKYAPDLAGGDLDPARFRALYSQAVRIVPTRFLRWHGRGERHAAAAVGLAAVATVRGRPSIVARIVTRLAGVLEEAAARLRHVAPAAAPA